MSKDWQTWIALAVVLLAGVWAGWLLLGPFMAGLRAKKPGSCGGCGCGKSGPAECGSESKNDDAGHSAT